jgi:hypothetical protein
MAHDWVLWVLVTCTALHIVEERALGWQGWAAGVMRRRIGVAPSWLDFWATNGSLVVFAFCAAAVGWRAAAWALALPALCVINALAFHLLPSVAARRPNPGLFTACALYLPVSVWAYCAAAQDDVLATLTVLGGVAIGAAAMAAPILVLVLAARFGYPDAAPVAERPIGAATKAE